MKEQLYTIPVNDAFETACECPVCVMYQTLEKDAIDFTMGPSYMEDDIRMETNRTGFCSHHVKMLYKNKNRLGLALMLHTHMQQVHQELNHLISTTSHAKKGLFSKKTTNSPISEYIQQLEQSCYICSRIDHVFQRYIATIFHCYHRDENFRILFSNAKGFCTKHFGLLYEEAQNVLSGKELDDFLQLLSKSYLENMKRVTDDLEWFTDKFDYRNADAPWKNSRDAVPRSITKMNSIPEDEIE